MTQKTRRRLSVAAMLVAAMPILMQDGPAYAADATVDLAATKQLIRGFGASSAWNGTISTGVMDSLYKTLGYSILRVRIEENIGDAWSSGKFTSWAPELANAKNAIARGAIVFASPWNPPASMKSGGKLNTAKYGDYAEYLKAYAKYFADNDAPLFAISIQNEPDYASDWTAWSGTDLLNFLKAQGASLSGAVKIMMPESFQFIHAMSDPSLNDATAASYISIIGGHLYGGKIQEYPLATNQGKELWETEHYFDDDSTSNIMKMAKEIHDCMVVASMNAYVYWWIIATNGLANSGGTIYKRAYVLGQFAKYVRPGYHRVDATASPASGVSVSAYRGDDKVVIVAVNTGSSSVNQNFVVRGGSVSQISSWQTSASANMVAGQSYEATGGSFSASLPGQSITTFVGSLSGVVLPDAGAPDATPSDAAGGRDSRDAMPPGQGGISGGTGGAVGSGGAIGTGGKSGSGGASGTGGTLGTGGSTVAHTGGSVGSGGKVSTGGMPSTGGTTNGGTSAGGGGGGVAPDDASSGCSCAVGGTHGVADARMAFLLVLCGLAFARRLRRR
jgi:glucuronoarabinoxylan endo-1,4-beta-xylanase